MKYILLLSLFCFISCQQEGKTVQKEENPKFDSLDLAKGKDIALQTKAILGSNLVNAIETKGFDGAVSFCSTKAITLTDSAGVAFKGSVKRVSDKNRNPQNKANEQQLAYINQMQENIAKGEKPKPQMQIIDGQKVGYYPIVANDQMCLNCHGVPNQDIKPKTFAKIKELYPDDKATGYALNQLRGIWVIGLEE